MLCFERGAGSKALRKLNLIIKQLYKMRKLDLLSKGKELNEKLYFGHKKSVILHFLLLSYSLRAISDVSLYNCTTDNKAQVSFTRAKSCKCAQSTKVTIQYQKRIHDRHREANKKINEIKVIT